MLRNFYIHRVIFLVEQEHPNMDTTFLEPEESEGANQDAEEQDETTTESTVVIVSEE